MTIAGMKPRRLLMGIAVLGGVLLLANCPNPVLQQINDRAAAANSGVSPFVSFSFTSALNTHAGVSLDVTGTISGADVTITVPYGTTLTALIATFTTSSTGTVSIGGTAQVSGTTANDFSNPVQYTLTAADGTTYIGTVTVSVGPAGVVLSASTLSLAAGGQPSPILYTISPPDPTAKFTWTNSDSTIIKTTDLGLVAGFDSPGAIWEILVTPLATGTATLTLKTADGSKSASVAVTVTPPVYVTGIALSSSSLSLPLGSDVTYLNATVTPSNATNKFVTWTSSNAGIASVDAGGAVTAVAVGYAVITATTFDGNKTATCLVTVTSPVAVSGLSVSPTSATMAVGQTYTTTINATITPANATNKHVNFTSDNSAVATVQSGYYSGSSYGYVTAGSVGTAHITGTSVDGNFTATATITVTAPVAVTGVSISPPSFALNVGSSTYLNAYTVPSNATNQDMTWSSDNLSAVSINYSGSGYAYIQGVGTGSANLTVTTADGNKTAVCAVTVNASILVNLVTLSNITIGVNQVYNVSPTITPLNATNSGMAWSTLNPAVATAVSQYQGSQYGNITGASVGSTTMTATSTDGSNKSGSATVTVSAVGTTTITAGSTVLSLSGTRDTTVSVAFTTAFTSSNTVPVVWSSDNPSVATATTRYGPPQYSYQNTGYVYAYAQGTAHIRATPTDGSSASNQITITVGP